MKAAGIIAEFDPFHNGHAYLIRKARESGCTHIAVAMSGSAVQRGEPASFDKFARAKAAVAGGADLVLELPAPYSCSNAEVFASAGVSALSALGKGVTERLVFGSEITDTSLIVRAAEAADSLADSEAVAAFLRQGDSYPLAVSKACRSVYGAGIAGVFENPNSTLALEYCRAIKRSGSQMEPFAVERTGAAHDSAAPEGDIASASCIRRLISEGGDVSRFTPMPADAFRDPRRLDSIFLYALTSADRQTLEALPDSSEAIASRVLAAAAEGHAAAAALIAACKTKNLTLARLRRLALHLVLGVTKQDIVPLPYVRILAFNQRGAELLSAGEHTLPVNTSLARLERTGAAAARVSQLERRASALVCIAGGLPVGNEYRKSIKPETME